ncbi:carbohydrate kinase family protein [Candidatus Saccharibacteria bacterium]|nr:carbohydrate kinase family protein [Candidatus Saccharibacteria bacterium]
MTKHLADLLGNDHPLFSRNIADMEQASGHAGIDTRLLADILEAAHKIMRRIGIDPADTSSKELYHALNATVQNNTMFDALRDASYVLLKFPDGVISFNILDVIENAHHELPYDQRKVDHGQRHLRMEVIKRYAEHERTDHATIHMLAEGAGIKLLADEHHQPLLLEAPKQSLLAIGDIFTDAFIKLSEDVAHVETDDNDQKWINIPFGGRPPYEEVEIVQSVGPAPNSAVSFARLGLDASLLAWLGDDQPGKESLEYLAKQGVDVSLMSQKPQTKSNYYYVLRLGAERTILTKDENYDYVWKEPAQVPDWIYLASISEESWQLHVDLLAYLEAHPETKLVLQPGTFHFKWGIEKLKEVFARSYATIMNREEAVDMTGRSYDDVRELANGLHELGPQVVVITDGPNGSYASYDYKFVTMPNYPDPAPPYDRTGAGDAFASTIVAALAHGETMETALKWAPINSMSVVQKLGAQAGLLRREEIEKYLAEAPEEYRLKEL